MALVKGTNSYVDDNDALNYFEDRVNQNYESGYDVVLREQALVTATQILETLPWMGRVSVDTQPLAFPRLLIYYDPARGVNVNISDGTEAPVRIQNAACELAYHLLQNATILDDTGTVTDLSLGTIELTTITSANLLPATVRRLVNPLLPRGGGRAVFVGG